MGRERGREGARVFMSWLMLYEELVGGSGEGGLVVVIVRSWCRIGLMGIRQLLKPVFGLGTGQMKTHPG